MGCTSVGSLVNAIAQITFFEGMVEIVIAIMAIPIATLVDHAAVVIPTTIMTTVLALTVV
jgi:hypothetical protein